MVRDLWTAQPIWSLRSMRTLVSDAIVMGGGLAGTALAEALQRRGLEVSLIEKHSALAQEASGQAASIAQPILHRKVTVKMRLALIGFAYLRRHLNRLRSSGHNIEWEECGVLQLAYKASLREGFSRAPEFLESEFKSQKVKGWHIKDPRQTAAVCGLDCPYGAFYFPQALWLRPQELCRAHVSHPKIRKLFGQKAWALDYAKAQKLWKVHTQDKKDIAQAPYLILACAKETLSFAPLELSQLPLRSVRGQTFLWPNCAISKKIQCVISYDGYVIPRIDKQKTCLIGASFEEWNHSKEPDPKQNLSLYRRLLERLPALKEYMPSPSLEKTKSYLSQLPTRVAFRCTSPDRLPLCGSLFGFRGKVLDDTSLSTLYLSTAYGSHGLLFAPLGAELIAKQICKESKSCSLGREKENLLLGKELSEEGEEEMSRAISPLRYRTFSKNKK